MPEQQRQLTRADLPEELTPETLRRVPLDVLRRLTRPDNGVLDPQEQEQFNAVMQQVMREAASRVSRQMSRSDWAKIRRDADATGSRPGGRGPQSQVDDHVRRLAQRIGQQVDTAEALAPGVDWSFAQPTVTEADTAAEPAAGEPAATGGQSAETVSDLEDRLTEQVELVQVMSEIAEVSNRTYALEQARDLQNTRTVFFGFVVSVAVLIAGWAPLVVASDWAERGWIVGLTLATCAAAAAVYGLVRWRQKELLAAAELAEPT